MTDKEKAKAYDEALERARKMLNMILDNELLGFPDQIREIFPQLKESKDEKIREEMIQYFTEMKKGGSAALPYDDCIAYLEKQKDLDKMIVVSPEVWDNAISDAFENGKREGEKQKEQKPAEKQDYSDLNDLEKAIHRGFLAADVENVPVTIIKETAKDCLAQINLAGWSEEDKKRISEIEFAVMQMKTERQDTRDKCLAWLKSLRPQPKNEWSEEDEKMRNNLVSLLVRLSASTRTDSTSPIYSYPREIDWLKSLSPSWKPSEEQMKAIKHAYNSFPNDCSTKSNLRLLYHDLEKLM